MSKSVGKLLGAGNARTKQFASERQYLDYLNKYDTSNVDSAYKDMAAAGSQLSSTLQNRPGYVYSVDSSDAASRRAEMASYNQAVAKLEPEFESRRRQMETRLQNQGFSPTSEAYQSAMNSLESAQNSAYADAAYNSIQAGQNAFSNSLNNQLLAANFQNSARQLPVSEINNLLQNQYSGYDIANQIFNVQQGRDARINQAKNQNAAEQFQFGTNAILGAGNLMAMAFSDRELKDNIACVGKLHNGLPVYLFTYKGDNEPRLGLMAQDVLSIHPEAVSIDRSGYFKVNYALACE